MADKSRHCIAIGRRQGSWHEHLKWSHPELLAAAAAEYGFGNMSEKAKKRKIIVKREKKNIFYSKKMRKN